MRRWLSDWHSLATIVGAVLVGLLAVLVVTSIGDREQALHALQGATASEREARQAAIHRIDQLLAKISDLEVDAQGNGQQLAVLRREVDLLQQQVRELGGQPVIVGSGSDGTPPEPRAPSRPSPRSSPPRSPRPSPRPTTTPAPSPTCIVIVCI